MMNSMESTSNQDSAQNSVSNISRRDLKGIAESSAIDSSMVTNNVRGVDSQISNTKLSSNIDSIYGFYKKKDEDGDDEMEDED